MLNALHRFWNAFTLNGQPVPAYPADDVPPGADFPYLTYACPKPAFGTPVEMTAVSFHARRSACDPHAERADLWKQIARAIPHSGTLLEWADGFVSLYPAVPFQHPLDPAPERPDGLTVLRGETRVEVRGYGA